MITIYMKAAMNVISVVDQTPLHVATIAPIPVKISLLVVVPALDDRVSDLDPHSLKDWLSLATCSFEVANPQLRLPWPPIHPLADSSRTATGRSVRSRKRDSV